MKQFMDMAECLQKNKTLSDRKKFCKINVMFIFEDKLSGRILG